MSKRAIKLPPLERWLTVSSKTESGDTVRLIPAKGQKIKLLLEPGVPTLLTLNGKQLFVHSLSGPNGDWSLTLTVAAEPRMLLELSPGSVH